jgi:eukaryotic-like serine/threonine-protein kinase
LLGRMPEQELEAIAAHVDGCPRCQSSIEAVDNADDSLVAELHGPAGDQSVQDEELEELVSRAAVICRDAPRTANGDVPKQLGQYQLLEKLGQGGMGTVYKAFHTKLKRIVAIKVLTARRLDDSRAVARFQREMEAVGGLDHPNIVRAHDAGEADGQHFLVMEFVEGVNLSRLVRACGPLSVADACEIIRQAAIGLHSAHQHDLVHRDVKPSNLMLTPQGTVKVLDLGLARLRSEGLTEGDVTGTGQIVGSPDFMAPEQGLDPRDADAHTDVYSLGCTLYFLLTGKPPFADRRQDTFLRKVMAHANEEIAPIEQQRTDVPAELASLLGRMLAKNPAERPGSMADVSEALGPLAAGHELLALLINHRFTASPEGGLVEPQAIPSHYPQALTGRRLGTAGHRFRRRWYAGGLGLIFVVCVIYWSWPKNRVPTPGDAPARIVPVAEDVGNREKGKAEAANQGLLVAEGQTSGVVLTLQRGDDEPITFDLDVAQSIQLPPGQYDVKMAKPTRGLITAPRVLVFGDSRARLKIQRFEIPKFVPRLPPFTHPPPPPPSAKASSTPRSATSGRPPTNLHGLGGNSDEPK